MVPEAERDEVREFERTLESDAGVPVYRLREREAAVQHLQRIVRA